MRRAVENATAAADSFHMDDDDDDDEAGDVQDQPHVARDLKEELSGIAEQPANFEEAPIVTAKGFRSALPQHPTPVMESNKLLSPKVIGTNVAAELEQKIKKK